MKIRKGIFYGSDRKEERWILAALFLFVTVNFLFLAFAEKLGPPDFYKFYNVAGKLYSGDFNIGIIPPLFPLLLYPLGKLIGLAVAPTTAFMVAARLISLVSALGVTFFTYRFLQQLIGSYAGIGTLFMVVSPWFQKPLAFPISDMMGLFFVTAALYSFQVKSWKISIWGVLGGVFTRFEGVLLIPAGIFSYFKLKKNYFIALLASLPVVAAVFFFFSKFASRIFLHFRDIILPQKSYLFVFLHPLQFLNVLYGNILYFVPYTYPGALKWALLIVVLLLFCYGFYRLFLIDKGLALAIAVYEILFLMAKGYINTEDPGREFRRILPALWVFYIVVFIGCCFLVNEIKKRNETKKGRILQYGALAGVGILLIGLIVSMPIVFSAKLAAVVLFVPPLLLIIRKIYFLPKGIRYTAMGILFVFSAQLYIFSHGLSSEYVVSYARKAAYAAAQWINMGKFEKKTVILSYTDDTMMDYYLKPGLLESGDIQRIMFRLPIRYAGETQARFKRAFLREVKERGVDYVIFDNYVVQKAEFQGVNDIQKLLYEEKENKQYFRIKNYLFYKGRSEGHVLKTTYVQTNH